MRTTVKRITALLLVLLLTASLLASCSGKAGETENADTYVGENVDLGLAENEKLMDIIEVDGELRATVGVTSEEMEAKYGTDYLLEYNTPYKTEYRYFNMAFVEDIAERADTVPFYQIAQAADPSLNLVLGGEPYLYTDENGVETCYGVRYRLYKDEEKMGDVLNPRGETNYGRYTQYYARANVVWTEETSYAWINYDSFEVEVFVKDHFLEKADVNPDVTYNVFGVMEIGGSPYALIHGAQYDRDETYFVDPIWEATRLVPLTPETTKLSLAGIEIEGIPTGGVCSDGTYGYYMCGSELWRTDGKTSARISDLIFCGVGARSYVRAVRSLSDGRILVVADGNLIILTESDHVVPTQRNVYTIGVVNFENSVGDLSLSVAKFNDQSDTYKFAIKEYKDITKMNLALLSEEVDVIVTSDQFMLKNYIKQDFLAPLEEVAPELFEEGVLIQNIVEAARVDGSCYYLPRAFAIEGRIVECRLLEEGQTFETPRDYYDFVREKSPGYLKISPKEMILTHLGTNIDEWIDWESNTCHFADGTFEDVLEFCNEGIDSNGAFDDSIPTYTGLCSLNGLIPEILFASVNAAKEYLEELPGADLGELPVTGEDAWAWVCLPFPSTTHDGYEISASQFFAVVDKEESRKAAKEFLSYHFLEDVVEEIAPDDPEEDFHDWSLKGAFPLPINQAECERLIGRNLSWDGEDKETRLPMEQRRYEDTWGIIRQADYYRYYRNAIFDIMMEEGQRYFDGDITAKQAAEYVQNRVSLYLAEQG
ncbi:MAG: hypothetical protein IJF34_08965 [Clostridia bacterium]|nr:hypothetical protein [Clostridia bacterium]